MGKLAARSLRYRIGGFTATFLALFIGATLVMACGGLMETGVRNVAPPERLVGADLLITGDRTHEVASSKKHKKTIPLPERVELPAALVDKARAVPGVRSATGERTFDAAVLGAAEAKVQAHGWESAALTPYALTSGSAPAAGEVVLDAATARRAGVATGERVRIAAHGGSAGYRVSGVAVARGVPQATVFFSAPEAARLSGRPETVADIAVTLAPGARLDDVRKGIQEAFTGNPVTLLSGDDRGAVEHPEVVQGGEDLIALSGVVGGLVILVAAFVVAGTVALSASQRSRELALLRAIGTSTGQLRRMLLGETLMVMVLAGAAAWPAGPFVGRRLFDTLVDSGMIADTVRFSQGWIPAMPAYGALLLTALAGGLLGSARAVQAKPVEALGEAAVQKPGLHPVRIAVGLLFLAGTVALALVTALVLRGPVAASTAGPTVMCCAIALALLGPWFAKLVTLLLHWPVRLLTGPSGRLAALNCRARTAKVAAIATPVMLASAIATGNLYLQTTTAALADRAFADNLRADAVLTSSAGGVDPALLARVRALPSAAGAGAYVTSRAYTEKPHDGAENKKGLPLQGVSAEGVGETLAVTASAGSLDGLRGNAVALPETVAHRMHRTVGDTITLRLGDGARADVRIVALFKGREGFDTALTSAELLAPHTTAGLPSQLLVRAAAGDRDRLMADLGALAAQHPGLKVSGRDAVTAAQAESNRTQASVNYLIIGMLVAYTALSVVNTTAVAVGNRRKEFALQRLTGATRGQVLRMMTVEGCLVALVGLLLGAAAAASTLVPFGYALGSAGTISGPPSIALTVIGAGLALTLAATLLPTWWALRSRPVEAARA
ncbi:FtsX-like permease family protein [Streptomyces rectiverticillatus]|uniref:ABC transporter permease n=1 Tax=Streptomyces rectiverticillatus TaxID=173860 RepID=UPI0015C32943|nr:FtsX-like permease family protein [Streptomyces rectiverticillatus]QLE76068.1 FtsX-like permease family protein [Streptomyces rectiverticillatus]